MTLEEHGDIDMWDRDCERRQLAVLLMTGVDCSSYPLGFALDDRAFTEGIYLQLGTLFSLPGSMGSSAGGGHLHKQDLLL